MFITFEGIDGAGKSTHIQAVLTHLRGSGRQVVATREPGGTPLGEQLRHVVLNQEMDLETEALIMFAARKEHLATVIKPALAAGHVVVCDRFTDATFAYQGAGRGIEWARLEQLEQWVHGDLQPDLTIIFDLSPDIAAQRMQQRAGTSDKFEVQPTLFFDKVRQGYLRRAREYPARCRVIDASGSVQAIGQEVIALVNQHVLRAAGQGNHE